MTILLTYLGNSPKFAREVCQSLCTRLIGTNRYMNKDESSFILFQPALSALTAGSQKDEEGFTPRNAGRSFSIAF